MIPSLAIDIEAATLSNAPLVMQLISHCLTDLRSRGIHQWDEIYPNLEGVENDARAGSLFVIRHENACVASVCLNESQPEQYRLLPWRCVVGRALVIHRLCVHPQWQGRGLAGKLMDFTEDFARRFSFASIRLDAYTGNPRALALYEKRGYHRIGQASFPRRVLPFDCFEKIMA